jgi:hypothetical protein
MRETSEDRAMKKVSAAALASVTMLGLAAPVIAAAQPVRVRGEVQSLSGNTLNVNSYNGKATKLTLNSQTKYQSVVPAHLSDINQGDFVGVGATGPESDLKALEVVIFPASMRGTGEGHYAWSVPSAVANADRHAAGTPQGAPPVHGTMTNGTVVGSGSSAAAPPVQGSMTNGTVATSSSNSSGQRLAVTYNNGKQVEITVPSGTPVVRLAPAQRSELQPGAKIFALASDGNGSSLTARSIAVGKNGLMPPM